MDVRCPTCQARHFPSKGPLDDGLYRATCLQCGTTFRFSAKVSPKSNVTFSINGKSYTVGSEAITTKLSNFIRTTAGFTGTKTMCREGGCGACVVTATFPDPITGRSRTAAVNSCLCPVLSCDGWTVTTTEGVGGRGAGLQGYHPIQRALAEHNGSQCGYCTPGMVMNAYSYLTQNPRASQQEIEDCFDGQICRCTGYRAILDAAHSIPTMMQPLSDIEDLSAKCKNLGCKSTGTGACAGACAGASRSDPVYVGASVIWLRPTSLLDLYQVLEQHKGQKVRVVVGNTSTGIYKSDGPYDVFVDTKAVPELYKCKIGSVVEIGANVTLTSLIEILGQVKGQAGFEYCGDIEEHIKKIASTPVRNVASWAGNLMVKHAHPEFPSDVFVMLEAASVDITVGSASGSQTVSACQLLDLDMSQKVVTQMTLKPMTSASQGVKFVYRSFKIMPRSQDAYAYVNAALCIVVDDNLTVRQKPRLVFGGISKTTSHAVGTEGYLEGKSLGAPGVLSGALTTLWQELHPQERHPGPSGQYRVMVAVGLLYKVALGILGDRASAAVRSGATSLQRPLSSGTETYDTDKTKWPLTEPITKRKAIMQAAGEAEYVDDMGPFKGELFAAFILTTQANATIGDIDASAALKLPGVVRFVTAADIPEGGINNFYVMGEPEEVFCSGKVLYAGQPVGMIVAESEEVAEMAAKLVKISYTDIQPPILTIQQAIASGSLFPDPAPPIVQGDVDAAIAASKHQLSGQVAMGSQYHFYMETQSCICVPSEDWMDVYPASQWPDFCVMAVSTLLNIPNNRVRVRVKRVGGAYGGKASRSAWLSAACALAAQLTQRPVRMKMPMETCMKMMGKRHPYLAKYKVGFADDGKLNGVEITYYADSGCSPNDQSVTTAFVFGDNAYQCDNWKLVPKVVKTNTASNTWCRSPGSAPAIFIMESIIEAMARSLGAEDGGTVRARNLYGAGAVTPYGQPLPYCSLRALWKRMWAEGDVEKRREEIVAYNKENRWKKRGLSVVPMKFGIDWRGGDYNCLLSVYHGDASVVVQHGGIEMGQGIDMKVMQVVARELCISLGEVSVRPTDSVANANSNASGGSITSELCCRAAIECCKQITDRLAPLRQKSPGIAWKDLIAQAYDQGVDLSARYWVYPSAVDQPTAFRYCTYGVTCAEVELDVLTGERIVRRADVLYDCGDSMNPLIDMGQSQGAFVMGLGYYLQERLEYDPTTGENLTAGTWEYHAPTSKDIPVDFRISFLKDAPNPLGVLGAKAVGEPPLTMSCAALFALQDAIYSARQDTGNTQRYVQDAPCTIDVAQQNCLTAIKQMTA